MITTPLIHPLLLTTLLGWQTVPEDDQSMKQAGPGAEETRESTDPPPITQAEGFKLFPQTPPQMMPYLATVNLYGNSCLQEGAAISGDPISAAAQAVKTQLSQYGVNYAIWNAYDFVAMSGTVGDKKDVLNYYSFNSFLTWNIFQSDDLSGTSGWITAGASAGTGFGYDANAQNAQINIGAIGFPTGADFGDRAYLYQLAWQQSFLHGQLVVTAGLIDPEMYLDLNTYSNNQYNQLMNYEFINPGTLPWSYNSLGLVVQWQPVDWFYAMFQTGANNTLPDDSVFTNISSDNWTSTFELGLIDEDVLGLGRGVLRVLPFWGTSNGDSGAGFMVNAEQRLGKDNPLGVFMRTGFTNSTLGKVQGAKSSFASGLVLSGPLESALMKTKQSNLSLGFYWLESPFDSTQYESEYGVELTYVYQLTETMTLQPDLQFIFDPVDNTGTDFSTTFTLQVVYTW